MADGLKRYQQTGHLHFVTFCCYHRRTYLETAEARDLFEDALERIRYRYEFCVVGYVVMLEHVHLLVSEPATGLLATGIQALKLSVTRRDEHKLFWQARYYDFNVFTDGKRTEKLDYMHWNPVRRALVGAVGEWPWSSYRTYQTGVHGRVTVDTTWRSHWRPE